jgi:hypothetical protein
MIRISRNERGTKVPKKQVKNTSNGREVKNLFRKADLPAKGGEMYLKADSELEREGGGAYCLAELRGCGDVPAEGAMACSFYGRV